MPRSEALVRKQGHLVAVPEISINFIPWKICLFPLLALEIKIFYSIALPEGGGRGTSPSHSQSSVSDPAVTLCSCATRLSEAAAGFGCCSGEPALLPWAPNLVLIACKGSVAPLHADRGILGSV